MKRIVLSVLAIALLAGIGVRYTNVLPDNTIFSPGVDTLYSDWFPLDVFDQVGLYSVVFDSSGSSTIDINVDFCLGLRDKETFVCFPFDTITTDGAYYQSYTITYPARYGRLLFISTTDSASLYGFRWFAVVGAYKQ